MTKWNKNQTLYADLQQTAQTPREELYSMVQDISTGMCERDILLMHVSETERDKHFTKYKKNISRWSVCACVCVCLLVYFFFPEKTLLSFGIREKKAYTQTHQNHFL